MYASGFDYVVAASWEEAARLLHGGGDAAKVIAGGQSLIPMMTLRLATPGLLVDVSRADDSRITRRNGTLVLPALVRHADLMRSPEVAAACPLMAGAASFVGNVRVRNRGTLGGSLAHADPSAELPCAALAVGATIRLRGPDGERAVEAREFFRGYFTTAVAPDEVVTAVEVPAFADRTGWAFAELLRRAGDFGVVEVAAVIELDAGGRCSRADLCAGGVSDRPVVLADATAALLGEVPDERAATEAARRAAASVDPPETVHASGAYRREMLGVFVRRAVAAAAARAGARRA